MYGCILGGSSPQDPTDLYLDNKTILSNSNTSRYTQQHNTHTKTTTTNRQQRRQAIRLSLFSLLLSCLRLPPERPPAIRSSSSSSFQLFPGLRLPRIRDQSTTHICNPRIPGWMRTTDKAYRRWMMAGGVQTLRKSTSDRAMMAMPPTKQRVTILSRGSYLKAVGSSSEMQMLIIMPATRPKTTPYALSSIVR